MSWWMGMRARWHQVRHRGESEQRMRDEMDFHLEMEAKKFERTGLSPSEARRRARLNFGSVDGHQEAMRDDRRLPIIETLLQDTRYALRAMRRDRTFAALIVGTLAAGIGAAVTMFSVLYAVVLRELPVRSAKDIVVMWASYPNGRNEHLPVSYTDLTSMQHTMRSIDGAAGVAFQGAVDVVMRDGNAVLTIPTTWVTGNLFPLLGLVPVRGRALQPADDLPGATPVMVISHDFWQRHYQSADSVVGSVLTWNGLNYTVVGVLPRGFEFPKRVQAWLPVMQTFPATLTNEGGPASIMLFDVVARRRSASSTTAVIGEFATVLRQSDARRPSAARGQQPVVQSLAQRVSGDVRGPIIIISAAVGLVLLIACLNVANLLLIRGTARTHELAIRSAIGAGRSRIVRQLITETAVQALCGGVLGTLLAVGATRVIVALAPAELPQREMIGVDGSVLVVAIVVTALAACVGGLLPAMLSTRGDLGLWLRGASSVATRHRRALFVRHALVVAQVAIAVIVVVSAGLLTRSLRALAAVDMGFNANNLWIAETGFLSNSAPPRERQVAIQRELLERTLAIAGVMSASVMPKPPFAGEGGWLASYSAEGQSDEAVAQNPTVSFEVIGTDYFQTLQLPLRDGRVFASGDHSASERVVIVDESLAEKTWPNDNPLGKRLKLGALSGKNPWMTVVGVVGISRYRELVKPQPSLYLPTSQFNGPVPMTLAIRQSGTGALSIANLRTALRATDSDLVLANAAPMSQLMSRPLARLRFSAAVLGAFAAITFALAVVGVYSALATTVHQRRKEIAVRMAIGASARRIQRLVLREGMLLALIGCAIGLALASTTSRVLHSILFGVPTIDLLTYALVATTILGASTLACWIPARRASATDPLMALRSE